MLGQHGIELDAEHLIAFIARGALTIIENRVDRSGCGPRESTSELPVLNPICPEWLIPDSPCNIAAASCEGN
jgi:hypothetical protein